MANLKDITGKRFGKLFVRGRGSKIEKDGCLWWDCQCDCGNSIEIRGRELRQQRKRNCGCRPRRRADLGIGERFGRLVVVEKVIWKADDFAVRKRPISYKCKCDCGEERIVSKNHLFSKRQRSCGCLRKEACAAGLKEKWKSHYGKSMQHSAFTANRAGALKRGLEWSLTKDQFVEIGSRDCHYCGCAPSGVYKSPFNNGDFVCNGIDRVDNLKGYTLENSVPCCKWCNRAKSEMKLDQFKGWIQRCYSHFLKTNWSK